MSIVDEFKMPGPVDRQPWTTPPFVPPQVSMPASPATLDRVGAMRHLSPLREQLAAGPPADGGLAAVVNGPAEAAGSGGMFANNPAKGKTDWRQIAGIVGTMLLAANNNPLAGTFVQHALQRRRDEQAARTAHEQRVQDREWTVEDRDFKARQPIFRNTSNEVVQIDPTTGQAVQIYKGTLPAEDYAAALDLEPGTPEFEEAMQDYILRGNGPTAYEYDTQLEGTRYRNRLGVEDYRQRNRIQLRQMPTYADRNPRPRVAPRPRAATPSTVLGGIYERYARGEKLTPQEQQLLQSSTARGGRRSEIGGVGGGAPTGPQGSATNPVVVNDPAQARKLPSGTYIMTPKGLKVVP